MNGDWKDGIWGVTPRNKEQQFAFEMLMDPEVEVVSLVGKAGSGKTLCALAAGIEQILKPSRKKDEDTSGRHTYNRLIVTRPVQPLGKDIGYLPGTMEEKMAPWLMPIQDNLQYLLGDDRATLEMYMSDGIIELEALTYIRGRSISNAFIIVDEAQNLTKHELKTIITRVGEGTKIVLTGDIEQIDNIYVDETSNGLTYAVERLKKHDITGHVTLTKGERSKVATLASRIL
jgi:PhoH-like ATPase